MLSALAICSYLLSIHVAKSCTQVDFGYATFVTPANAAGLVYHDGRSEIFEEVQDMLWNDAVAADYPIHSSHFSHTAIVTSVELPEIVPFLTKIDDVCESFQFLALLKHDLTASVEDIKTQEDLISTNVNSYFTFVHRNFNVEMCR